MALALVLMDAATSHAGGSHAYPAGDPVWKEECGSCHVAYPAQLLPAATWRVIMGGLDRHFGVDASVDAATARHIAAYLESSADTREARIGGAVTRITETRWFRNEHDELPAGVWKRPDVRSAANCTACHTQAEAGDYGKRTRRVPR
jgi:hypothetical protein